MDSEKGKAEVIVTASYAEQMLELVDLALLDIEQQHKLGKLADTPVSNTNFLVRWITKSIKEKRFSTLMAKDLIAWQKLGRSKGSKTGLSLRFQTLSKFYSAFFAKGQPIKPVLDSQIEKLMDDMEALGWSVSNEFDLTGTGKSQVFTDGESSFVLCEKQCESCFDGDCDGGAGEALVRPMSFYVRGNHNQFIEQALQCGLMLHKQTDYKSKVKYHGEYIIYPKNQGPILAEIPVGFA
ncbi:alpha-acetolactate decarboxylase [Vibrio sp. UCD-FRSSP16_10]|uniref:DUF2913 family protein n=1 Tax=unclassified Vibrio TaxID=2614977 RepID=UPI0008003EEC|nr:MULTISPECIES: DUF2913 family protein [unclassified Vibrio]OBT13497.1 alpha-acetolactate decarboxylase [Vibrio sp. UCD-FRSSP16_10]OBT18018.1 alpha-acetolactate decarboxylase [Vibrio sp. UCD-FRSSP16_30]